MFTRLLVPLDGTAEAAVALPPAHAMARATGAFITLLRVLPQAPAGGDGRLAEIAHTLERVAHELRADDLRVDTIVHEGRPATEIVRTVHEGRHDLVVMATHGRSGIERAVLGSVAERVVGECPVPVLLLRPGGRRVSRIETLLVPVDGSPGGAAALAVAVGLARATGARLVLLEAVVPILPLIVTAEAYGPPVYVDPRWEEDALDGAERYVQTLVRRLGKADLQAQGRAILGDPVATIVSMGRQVDADLVVMASHALTGPARAVLGSVSDAVIRSAGRPVLVVRVGERLPSSLLPARPRPEKAAPDAPREPEEQQDLAWWEATPIGVGPNR